MKNKTSEKREQNSQKSIQIINNTPIYKWMLRMTLSLLLFSLSACSFDGLIGSSEKEPMRAMDSSDESIIFVDIPSGSSTKSIAKILYDKKLIRNEREFVQYVKVKKLAQKMKSGHYAFSKSMDGTHIAQMIADGKVYIEVYKFTIPEGYEYRQMVELWKKHGLDAKKFEQAINDILKEQSDSNSQEHQFKFLNDVAADTHLEGYLFPDTYEFKSAVTEKQILLRMLSRFDEIFKEEYYERATQLGLSINEVITLASIIEREAVRDDERKLISGVFYNRINKNWKLQSCATVQYVLKDRKDILSFDDIKIDSKYNTYKYEGLPPAPIASVGEASILAALYPEDTEYMFFVAKGDGSGGHIFSKTLEEHNQAIKQVNQKK